MTFGTTLYFASLNELNQHLACCILMVSLILAYKKRTIPFIVSVIIAGLIHSTSFLFIIVYIFNYKSINRRYAWLIACGAVLALPLLVNVLQEIIKLTPYAHYLALSRYMGETSLIGILMQFAILCFVSFYYDKDNELYKFLYSINVLCLIITLLQGYIPLAYRIKWIFYYPVIIMIPITAKNIKDKKTALIVKCLLIILFSVYAYYQIVIGRGHGVYPYKGLWI